jgi:hypothetical protein
VYGDASVDGFVSVFARLTPRSRRFSAGALGRRTHPATRSAQGPRRSAPRICGADSC